MRNLQISLIIVFGIASISFSQPVDTSGQKITGRELAIKGIFDSGAVKLRWATGNTEVWSLIRQNGVSLLRQEAADDSSIGLNNASPINIWTEAEWKNYSKTEPAAAQVMTLLKYDKKQQKKLSDYALVDLEQNRLTSLLLMSEFNFNLARGLALAFVDSSIESGKIYRYQILIPDRIFGDTISAECIVSTDKAQELPPILNTSGIAGDGYIFISWTRLPIYSGYFVERSDTGRENWQSVNKRPLIFASNYQKPYLYRDSVANYIPYQYRIKGTDAFGRISAPSSIVEIFGRDMTPPQPPYALAWAKEAGGVQITWKNPPPEPDLAGYGLLKSLRPDDDYRPVYKELLPAGTTSYYDSLPDPGTYFYRLVAADTSGNMSVMSVRAMVVLEDTIPPAPPGNLSAVSDTNGIIVLRWNHCLENDVAGYRVYKMIVGGNRPEFLPLTPGVIIDTVFTDTLMAKLRDEFSYYVKSVDFAGNYSIPSAPVQIRLPDITPPITPIVENYSATDSAVFLSYISPSKDVAKYQIQRFVLGSKKPELSQIVTSTSWADRSLAKEIQYFYEITAIDSAQNESVPSKRLFVKTYSELDEPAPQAPKLTYQKSNRLVNIKWDMPKDKNCSALVFRKNGNGTFLQISPRLTKNSFDDMHISEGQYEYAIKFYYKEHGGTPLGISTSIIIPSR